MREIDIPRFPSSALPSLGMRMASRVGLIGPPGLMRPRTPRQGKAEDRLDLREGRVPFVPFKRQQVAKERGVLPRYGRSARCAHPTAPAFLGQE